MVLSKKFSELCNDFTYSKSSYLTYFAILSTITENWKEILKGHDEYNFDFNAPFHDESLECFLVQKSPPIFAYNNFIKKFCESNSHVNNLTKWETDASQPLENLILWSNRSLKGTLDTNIWTFQFKYVHRRIATNDYLCKMGVKQKPVCNFCEN